MNLDQLGASFTQNRTAILGTAAAGVVGLALYRRKQAAAAPAAPTAGATTAGVYSAGGQTAGMYGANAYDSSASDVYGLVQPQLESLGGQLSDLNTRLGSVPVSTAPASPIASSLLAPSWNGNLGRWGTTIGEIESDGSVLRLNGDQLTQYASHATPTTTQLAPTNTGMPQSWSVRENLAGKYPVPAPAPATS